MEKCLLNHHILHYTTLYKPINNIKNSYSVDLMINYTVNLEKYNVNKGKHYIKHNTITDMVWQPTI